MAYKDPEAERQNKKRYYEAHREEARRNMKRWRAAHREDLAAYFRRYRKESVQYRIGCNLRGRLNIALGRGYKAGSAVRDLGCTVAELKRYLESRFQLGMSWSNYGPKGWHIDHVRPLKGFDLTDRTQFLQACHYTNLQPLWWDDNLKKGARQ
jgi:hypothetical protein